MATVYVGSARIDENGKAYGGKAGDQTSKEVSRQAWYKHSKGWRVFRAKRPEVAAMIARQMQAACDNNNIGYDQWQRNTLYTQAEKVGFDIAKVKTACETDCSALVRVCCAAAGVIDLPSGFRTGNMPANLLGTGEFVELKSSKYTDQSAFLGAGDILVTRSSGHTVVVLNNGGKYEGTVEAKALVFGVDVLRKGDEGEAVKLMQQYLKDLGYDLGPSGTDGDFGGKTEDTLKAFQKDRGLDDDGVFGEKSHEAMMEAIDKLNDAPSVTPEPTGDLKVKAGSWRIRTGPGIAYATAGFVSGDETLTRVDLGKWVPVLYKGEVRFISNEGLEA